jgi:LAS superfamily LD-carboxypeptidase LdcB
MRGNWWRDGADYARQSRSYLKLKDDAEQENIQLSINSAFRTFQRQVELRRLFEAGKIYEWLKNNAPRHSFVRTVPDESWHWEYRLRTPLFWQPPANSNSTAVEDRA